MRLHLILPRVEPDNITPPARCPRPSCASKQLYLHQQVPKPLRDTAVHQVTVRRYRCLRCGHVFRVYPKGVSRDHTSQRVKGLGVLRYLPVPIRIELWSYFIGYGRVGYLHV